MTVVEGKAYKVPCEGTCRNADGRRYHVVKHTIAVAKQTAQASPLASWR